MLTDLYATQSVSSIKSSEYWKSTEGDTLPIDLAAIQPSQELAGLAQLQRHAWVSLAHETRELLVHKGIRGPKEASNGATQGVLTDATAPKEFPAIFGYVAALDSQ